MADSPRYARRRASARSATRCREHGHRYGGGTRVLPAAAVRVRALPVRARGWELGVGVARRVVPLEIRARRVLVGQLASSGQRRGRGCAPVDARSDLYALGAVAWFLLVGRPVFEGPTLVSVCAHHIYTPARRPSEVLGSAIAPALEDIVLACLEKDPSRRPPDARALRDRLEATGLAPSWTRERAQAWWNARQRSVPPATRDSSSARLALSLDVNERESASR